MKIGLIDYQLGLNSFFILEMRRRGVELYCEINLDNFERKYGSPDKYDGLLLHIGLRDIFDRLEFIRREHPNIPMALLTSSSSDYPKDNIPAFSYRSYEAITEYFRSHKKKGNF